MFLVTNPTCPREVRPYRSVSNLSWRQRSSQGASSFRSAERWSLETDCEARNSPQGYRGITPPQIRYIAIRNIIDSQAPFVAGVPKRFLNEWTKITSAHYTYSAYLVIPLSLIRNHCICRGLLPVKVNFPHNGSWPLIMRLDLFWPRVILNLQYQSLMTLYPLLCEAE